MSPEDRLSRTLPHFLAAESGTEPTTSALQRYRLQSEALQTSTRTAAIPLAG